MNSERKIAMARASSARRAASSRGKTIAVLGVTFKPNTDDMRDAPSLTIVPMLQERGASVSVYDPQGGEQAEQLLPGVIWCDSALEAGDKADIAVVLTEWNEFRALDLDTRQRAHARRCARRSAQYLPAGAGPRCRVQLYEHRAR